MAVRRWIVLGLALVFLTGACGAETDGNPGASKRKGGDQSQQVEPSDGQVDNGSRPLAPGGLEPPPPVTVRSDDRTLELHAWTYCYGTGCADGSPPADPSDIGDAEEVIVEFPLPGWSFMATFTAAGERCARDQNVRLEPLDEGRFVLRPAGSADTYDVTLFGRGDGDLFTTFRWKTPTNGPLPKPSARLALLADHDGRVDSYGIELAITNLAETPERSSATITVEAGGGESLTFEAKRSKMRCLPEGSLYWDGPDDKGLEAAALGDPPFTYIVELVLDGERYVARATWPKDVIRGNEPSVRLHFTPDLPALSP